ncbi:hypothetical protein FQN60_011110 [Etheostoma spectabile]|uniref:Uncharacterized protein n=1 Tax=Etheostoma spectabile TaxID=54343 RepID=A0A5J5DR58_9PERO|nr:hypothetical protein FQN60_011110 [Etheostoma spectabile]
MPQPEPQQTTPTTATEILDPAVHYLRRRKTALWVTVSLLALSLLVMAVGLISATRTTNVPVAGYYAGIVLSFGAFLGIVGIHLLENRRPMLLPVSQTAVLLVTLQLGEQNVVSGDFGGLGDRACVKVLYVLAAGAKLVAAIIFISIGVISSFFCAIVDGIIASEFIDIRPLQEEMCDFYASDAGYAYDRYYTEVNHITNYHTQYYVFTGVSSCWDVIHLYRLLWASVVLNVITLFLGIITAALLGAYKDVHNSSYQQPATPQMIPEGGHASNSCLSEENQQQPCQAPTQPQPQGTTQEPGGYMLTPNAPVLYGAAYNPFEKPPPYAC